MSRNNGLTDEIRECLSVAIGDGKKLMVVSDFDETLTNRYVFEKKHGNHRPVVSSELVGLIQVLNRQLVSPVLVCSGRGSDDPFIDRLSRISSDFLVLENGGVLLRSDLVEVLASDEELKKIEMIKIELRSNLDRLKKSFKKRGFVLLPRITRSTDIEFRLQPVGSKNVVEIDGEYVKLMKMVDDMIDLESNGVGWVVSGSAVSLRVERLSKWLAVDRVLSVQGIVRDNVFIVAFGDNWNDIDMFEGADMAINVGREKLIDSEYYLGGGYESVMGVLELINSLGRQNI